jgi:hypothetical protein
MAHRDGITNVLIFWDRKTPCFVAGTPLTGRIEVIKMDIIAKNYVKLSL